MPKFSQRSKDNLKGIEPNLVKVLTEAIKDSPVDFTITEGVRTAKIQADYFRIGRRGIKGERTITQKDGVKKKSAHQPGANGLGKAVDLYPFVGGKLLVTGYEVPGYLSQIALHIKATAKRLGIKIVWGGDWEMLDMPHFQL